MTELISNGLTVKAEGNTIIVSGSEFVMPADITMLYHIDNDIYIDCGGKYYIFTGNQFASIDRIPRNASNNYSAQGVSSKKNRTITNSTVSRLTPFSKFLIVLGGALLLYGAYWVVQMIYIASRF